MLGAENIARGGGSSDSRQWGGRSFYKEPEAIVRLGTEPKPVTSSVGFGTGPNRDRLGIVCPNKRTPIPEKIRSIASLTRNYSRLLAASLLLRCSGSAATLWFSLRSPSCSQARLRSRSLKQQRTPPLNQNRGQELFTPTHTDLT